MPLPCWTLHKPCQQLKHPTNLQQAQALHIFSNYFQIWSRTNKLQQTDPLNSSPIPCALLLLCQELKTLPDSHTADMQRKPAEFGMHVKTISSGKWLRSLLLLLSGNGVPNCSPDWLCCSWCFIFKVLKVQVNHTYHMTSPILWLFLPRKGKAISVSFVLFILTLAISRFPSGSAPEIVVVKLLYYCEVNLLCKGFAGQWHSQACVYN